MQNPETLQTDKLKHNLEKIQECLNQIGELNQKSERLKECSSHTAELKQNSEKLQEYLKQIEALKQTELSKPNPEKLKDYLNCYKTLLPKDQIKKFCTMISPHVIKNQYFENLNKMGDFFKIVISKEKLNDLSKLSYELFREPKDQCLPIIGKQIVDTSKFDIDEMLSEEFTVWYADIGTKERGVFLRDENSQNVYQLLVPEKEYDAFYENMNANLLLYVAKNECGLSIYIGNTEL